MRASIVNFARAALRLQLRTESLSAWLLLAVALAVASGVAVEVYGVLRVAATNEDRLALLHTRLHATRDMERIPSRPAVSRSQAAPINAAIRQLNLPWHELLDAVERATPKEVALLALEPDAQTAVVRGTAEAKTSDDMLGYIEALKKEPFFMSVVLVHHETTVQDPNRPLRFQFEAQWAREPS